MPPFLGVVIDFLGPTISIYDEIRIYRRPYDTLRPWCKAAAKEHDE